MNKNEENVCYSNNQQISKRKPSYFESINEQQKEEDESDLETMSVQEELQGHFDQFGQFKYKSKKYLNERKKKQQTELKNLSEENFLDLIAGKNQDRRFYHWLHFKPLFEGSDYSSDEDGKNIDDIDWGKRDQKMRSSSIDLDASRKQRKKMIDDQEEEDMNFFQELYAGINNMFENVYDETEEKLKEQGQQQQQEQASSNQNDK